MHVARKPVRRLTTDPMSARMSAGSTARARKPREGSPSCSPGRPVGTFPITGASLSHTTPMSVPANSPTRGVGKNFLNRCGQKTATPSVTTPTPKALRLMSASVFGSAKIMPTAPPGAGAEPKKGRT